MILILYCECFRDMSGKNFYFKQVTSYNSLKREWAILQSREVFQYPKVFTRDWISETSSEDSYLPGKLDK